MVKDEQYTKTALDARIRQLTIVVAEAIVESVRMTCGLRGQCKLKR